MSKPTWSSNKILIALVWIVAIAIRLYGATRPAQFYDIGTFEAWSRSLWLHGPLGFFSAVWSDYLPLPILTFAPISLLADLVHLPFGLVFKLIHIFIELILIIAISRSTIYALPSTILLLLSPALIGDSSFWGQVDTIPALLGLLSLSTLSPVIFGLAVAYKPIMILLVPVIWIKDIKAGKAWWRLPLFSSLIFFSTALPTSGFDFFRHMLTRVFAQTGTYPYLTINAFNFWSLHPSLLWIPDSTSVLSLSGHTLGLALFFVFSLITLNRWRIQKFAPKYAYRIAATIFILFFTFTTRMHERHLLFGLPFLALATQYQTFLFIPYLLLTMSYVLNLYGAYYWVNHAQTWPFGLGMISLISWVTTLTTIALVFISSLPQFLSSLVSRLKSHYLLVVILLLSGCLRFINLSYPSTYIFDEVYHAFTAREYLANHKGAWEWWTTPPEGVAYEWTHPPLAKYGMVTGMLLFGENSFAWRLGSAVMGVASILGLYLLVLSLTKQESIALLAAFLVSIEGLHIAQSRIAMNDMYMLNFYIWSLYAAVKSRWKLASVLFGLSLASKWSALYGLLPLALVYLHQNQPKYWNLKSGVYHLLCAMRYLLVIFAVYVLTFTPFILAPHTWAEWWELHRQMWFYHTHLVATHAYESTPIQWIFAARPVWYYVKYAGDYISNIYVQGNPAILWLGLVALILQLPKLKNFPHLLFTMSYALFTLPWILSPRIMFFYHYLPSSVFLCVILSTWLVSLPKKYLFSLLLLTSIVLLLISPMLYGFPMPNTYWNTFFTLFPSWK